MKLIGIQFRRHVDAQRREQESVRRGLGEFASIDFVDALDDGLPWNEPERLLNEGVGVVLGGSGDFDFDGGRQRGDVALEMSYKLLERLGPLCHYIFTRDIPTMGICFGHQLLGAFAGARVVNDHSQMKSRSHTVRVLQEHDGHSLFAGLPSEFIAHYGHKDSLENVPTGAVLLAEGGLECRVSALQYQKNIFTTQFHPELTFAEVVERMNTAKGYLPEGSRAEDLYIADDTATSVLKNFGLVALAHISA